MQRQLKDEYKMINERINGSAPGFVFPGTKLIEPFAGDFTELATGSLQIINIYLPDFLKR